MNDKLKYHDILLQNQGWKYSAPHPSTEYWSNFDEDEENEAEDFLNHIKKSTEDMRLVRVTERLKLTQMFPTMTSCCLIGRSLQKH